MAPLQKLLMAVFIASALSSWAAPTASATTANLTDILNKAGYFSTFLNVASEANVTAEVQAFIDASGTSGATLFVPVDAAFTSNVLAVYSGLSPEKKKLLLQYHGLPKFYDYSELLSTRSQSLSNLSTFAAGLSLNVSVRTGIITVHASLNSANVTSNYATTFPLTVFAIDTVLLSSQILGNPAPPTPPSPSPSPSPATPPTPSSALSPTPSSSSSSSTPPPQTPSSKLSPAPAPASSAPPPMAAAASSALFFFFSILLFLLHSTF